MREDARCSPRRSHASRPCTGPTGEAPQSVVAPVAWLDHIAATAWTRDASGLAALSQGIGSLLSILQGQDQGLHRGAPPREQQPHSTDTACRCYNALLPM